MLVMFPLNHENGQIIRTKRWLYEALGELMKEHLFADITVGHICKRADVSRAVFYHHYCNKEDLLLEVFKRIMTVYWTKLQICADENGHLKSRITYTILCKELWRSRDYLIQLPRNHYSYLLVDFLQQSHNAAYQLASKQPPPDTPEYRKYFIPYHANAMASILFQWLSDEDPVSPEEMADLALRLFRSTNVDSFLNPPLNHASAAVQDQTEIQRA